MIKRAFPDWQTISDNLPEDESVQDDFHKKVKSNAYRCLKWTSDDKLMRGAAVGISAVCMCVHDCVIVCCI